jgi:hypothetical protein
MAIIFLDRTPPQKKQAGKQEILVGLGEINNLYTAKETINREETTTEWKKTIPINDPLDKQLIHRICNKPK